LLKQFKDFVDEDKKLSIFNDEVEDFLRKHDTNDLQYYDKRFQESINRSDKLRYGIICWIYFKAQESSICDVSFFSFAKVIPAFIDSTPNARAVINVMIK
jgi:hypothetical protein